MATITALESFAQTPLDDMFLLLNDDSMLLLNDDSMENDMTPPPSQRPTRGLSFTLGTDLPISALFAPLRRVSAQIYDIEEEDEDERIGKHLNDDSVENDMPPPQRRTRGLSFTLGTDLPISALLGPLRRVSAQIYDVQEEEEENLSCSDSSLGDENDDSSLRGIEDALYMASKAEEKLLLDFASSVLVSASTLNATVLDCYSSTSTTRTTLMRVSWGPGDHRHPYLQPPRRSS
jgi:hypothetical protein